MMVRIENMITTTATNDMTTTVHSSCTVSSSANDWLEELRAMRRREADYQIGDYLHRLQCHKVVPDTLVNADCRLKMSGWAFSIIDHCHFKKETAAIAVRNLDRFLDVTPWALTDRSAFQLAAITSLYTSIKVNECQAIAVENMANLSQDVYTGEQIEAMERLMIETCQWLLNPPTVLSFGYRLAQWLSSIDNRFPFATILELTNMQLESAIHDYGLCTVSQSIVGIAAIRNSMEGMGVASEQERQQVWLCLCTILEIPEYDMEILPRIQARLYENLSDNSSTPRCTTDVASTPNNHCSSQSSSDPSEVAMMNTNTTSVSLRPTSPNSVAVAPSRDDYPRPYNAFLQPHAMTRS